MVRVLQFADIVNRYDFIDTIVQHADPAQFQIGLCVRSQISNIATPIFSPGTFYRVLDGLSKTSILKTAFRLSVMLRAARIDILHTHHYDQAVIGWLATRLYPHTRFVIGRHYSDALYRLPDGTKKKALLQIEQLINRAALRIIVPSSYISRILTDRQGITSEKIDLVPYGFDPEKYTLPAEGEVSQIRVEFGMNGRFVIGNFSRLHEEKGHRYLIEAASRLKGKIPGLLILLVGEGAERKAIERSIAEAGLGDTVRLVGWRRDTMAIMAAMDVIVQPTLQEAFSQVMAEALWMQKPLVITDVSGATDLIHDGENGLLVPKGDASALADAIQKLAADPLLRRRLGINGGNYVATNLDIHKIILRYEQSYKRAMSDSR